MRLSDWLKQSELLLQKAGLATARLDSDLLAADLLGKDRSWLHAHPEHELQTKQINKLNAQVARRLQHEPIAYIRGKQEFYGREFFVSPDTLTPRPETETMIELLIQLIGAKTSKNLQIVDVGTGSGCIIITAALELAQLEHLTPNTSYIGLDISEPALKIAKKNATEHSVNVAFSKFDLNKDSLPKILNHKSSVLLANLPYVPDDFHINLAASHEPPFAIFGGHDGLDYYRQLFSNLSHINPFPGLVFTESLPPQHSILESIANDMGYAKINQLDLIQVFKKSIK